MGSAQTVWATLQVEDKLTLDDEAQLRPMNAENVRLGGKDENGDMQGFLALALQYTHASVAGAQTINKPTGSVKIAAGASSVVVTNSLVSAESIVIPVLMGTDATLTSILKCIPAAGSFTITGNANATAAVKVGFLVICTDSVGL